MGTAHGLFANGQFSSMTAIGSAYGFFAYGQFSSMTAIGSAYGFLSNDRFCLPPWVLPMDCSLTVSAGRAVRFALKPAVCLPSEPLLCAVWGRRLSAEFAHSNRCKTRCLNRRDLGFHQPWGYRMRGP